MSLLLLACFTEETYEGTVIGNPGDGMTVVARSASVELEAASTTVDAVLFTTCDGDVTEDAVGDVLDLVEGTALQLAEGDWCSLTLVLDAPVEIEALVDETPAYFELEVPEIELSGDFTLGDDRYVVELAQPDWLEGVDLEQDEDDDTGEEDEDDWELEVDDEHPAHDELAEALATTSGLYVDPDGDGSLADSERTGTLAAGDARTDDAGAGGDTGVEAMASRGCRADSGNGAWMLLPLLALRRPRHR